MSFYSRSRNKRRYALPSWSIKPSKRNRCVALFQKLLRLNAFPQSIIIKASGEARSAELIGEAMRTNKGFLELRRLEAARDIATLLASSGNKVMLDSQSLLLNGTRC
jgi:hypothetical protein